MKGNGSQVSDGPSYLERVMAVVGMPALALDRQGIIQDLNRPFELMLVRSRHDLLGASLSELVDQGDDTQLWEALENATQNGICDGSDLILVKGTGGTVPVVLNVSAPPEWRTSAAAYLVVMRDATLEQRDQQQLQMYASELRQHFHKARTRLSNLTFLHNLSTQTSTSLEARSVSQGTLEGLRQLPMLRNSTLGLVFYHEAREEWLGWTLTPERSQVVVHHVAKEALDRRALKGLRSRRGGLLHIWPTGELPRGASRVLSPRFREVQSVMVLPLMSRRTCFGMLVLSVPQGELPAEPDSHFFFTLANQTALALHRAQLYEAEAISAAETAGLLRAIERFSSTVDVDAILHALADEVEHAIQRASFSVLAVKSPEEETFRAITVSSGEQRSRSLPSPQEVAFQVDFLRELQQGQPVVLQDPALLPRGLYELVGSMDSFTCGFVPLSSGDQLTGVVVWASATIPQAQVRMMQGLAREAAIALENARLYATERERTARLDQVEQLRYGIVATLGHELRTPVTALKTSAGLLNEIRELPKQREVFERLTGSVQRCVERIDALAQEALEGLSNEPSPPRLTLAPVDPQEVIEDATRMLHPLVRMKEQRIEVRHSRRPPLILADRHALVQILTNLLSNANKFAGHQTTITISTRRHGADIVFRVSDEGPGIPSGQLSTLLEGPSPMVVGQTRERSLKGLSLVRFLVERHHGRLWAQSQVGEGSTFSFTIPLGPRR